MAGQFAGQLAREVIAVGIATSPKKFRAASTIKPEPRYRRLAWAGLQRIEAVHFRCRARFLAL